MNYCLKCGTDLKIHLLDGRDRQVCERCGWVYYPQLKVGAAVLIEKDGCLLLLRRNNEPWKGCWNLPAGYVEADENPIDAAAREAKEETGLNVEIGELEKVYYFDDDPRGNGIVFVYLVKHVKGFLKRNDESSSARYFSWQDVPENLAKGGHNQAINEWRLRAQKKQSI
jgi:ADP-ribose pyrophosphatase YjhB (NUDIX family)